VVTRSRVHKGNFSDTIFVRETADESKTSAAPRRQPSHPKELDAGPFAAEVDSFRLHLAAEGKAGRTLHTYTEAVRWFAAAHVLRETEKTSWGQVDRQDLQRWTVWLLERYSSAYASNQYRALQQFFKWLAAEDEIADPMAGMRPPHVPDKLVPIFTSEELPRLERACAGRTFQQRRDAAVIAVFRATGIRLSELAGIRYDPGDPQRGDIDLWNREVTVHGKAGRREPSRSATTPPARSTGTFASAPGTRRRTGRSCG
jgi:site-specific recombinase XerC